MADTDAFALVRELFEQLRRRRLPIGPPDLDALRAALTAGFGWSSQDALRELIVALWAKSPREAAIVRALFARLAWPADWSPEPDADASPATTVRARPRGTRGAATPGPEVAPPKPVRDEDIQLSVARQTVGMPELTLAGVQIADARLMLVEQYPLTHREIAQAFRRLRRPMRFGPATDLDLDQTLLGRLRSGVAVPPVLVPRRRNATRLALFVDSEGSMAPHGPFVDAFCTAVREAGMLQQTSLHYFHDVPTEGTDRSLLSELEGGDFFPALDPVLSRIEPLDAGRVYADPQLEQGQPLRDLLATMAPGTTALVVSDAGAARGRAEAGRVQDSLAFVKALRRRAPSVVWLNPVPRPLWAHTSAAQLARHVPMFALDRTGIQLAVNALRGHPVNLERPL
ncbi:VWA domain-containing protein [Variovorax sp. KK3]|uniref:VWA domain-containing protein n=1 Tax=Variovorax sp. KK3 TaxID=1855728 RepID=UPI00097CAF4B|nr:VWA domain-containing protein [Variovorax sp. KK3]